jgi:DNA-binding MarR family transcriptional regulator
MATARSSEHTDPAGAGSGNPLNLFTHLARTSLFLGALQAECLEPFGLSFADYTVLRVLLLEGEPYELSPSRIAEMVVRTTGGMTKMIDRLERAGLVERSPDPNDRRGVLVGLTRRGLVTSAEASRAYQLGRERILDRLDGDEIEVIDQYLHRLIEVFEADREEQR